MFCVTGIRSLRVQPALCAHTAITFGTDASLLVSFHGTTETVRTRGKQVIHYCSTGISMGKEKDILKFLSDQRALNVLRNIGKKQSTSYEHLECFHLDQNHDIREQK